MPFVAAAICRVVFSDPAGTDSACGIVLAMLSRLGPSLGLPGGRPLAAVQAACMLGYAVVRMFACTYIHSTVVCSLLRRRLAAARRRALDMTC